MNDLQICLLGPFQVCWDFTPISITTWGSPWAPRLLKLLLVRRPDALLPAEVLRLLPGMTPGDIKPAIEAVLRILGGAADIRVEPAGGIYFEPGRRCWIDLDALLSHYRAGQKAAGRGDMRPAILAFQEADALYQGELLEEVQEPWVLARRREIHEIYTDILDRLAEGHAVLASYQDAIGFCHKALAYDPLREAVYQRMMVYHYYLGDREGASEAYQACRNALGGVGRSISQETDDLWQRLFPINGSERSRKLGDR